jgi:hypothetical protein
LTRSAIRHHGRTLATHRVENRQQITGSGFEGALLGQTERIGHTRAPKVKLDQPAERCKTPKDPSERRHLPAQLNVVGT